MDEWESDKIIEQWLHDNDGATMPLPNIESDPHLLISKVRKHYLEHLLKLLTMNYESNQKLMNKNIYLPSAIWRCAKVLEMSAARSSMVLQLYRQNVISVIKDLKENTKKGKLHRKLYDCLRNPPQNEKRTQTRMFECNCKCTCNLRKRLKIPKNIQSSTESTQNFDVSCKNDLKPNIPVVIEPLGVPKIQETAPNLCVSNDIDMKYSDDIMQQLEKLFPSENDDDIFDNTFYNLDNQMNDKETKMEPNKPEIIQSQPNLNDPIAQMQAKPLEERLALLSGILVNNIEQPTKESKENVKCQRNRTTKWMCEEYFLKVKLFELLDELRDSNRSKLMKIKNKMLDLFGCDSDDEGVVSPIDETEDFITSCKERITPWVVKILTPYYVKGRIRGKAVFKGLAKHLIQLIYQCSKYPYEYEVESFVKDFLESHTMIRCEADFQRFRIENI